MTYLGHVQDGIIVLDGQPNLPEGATVQVVLVAPRVNSTRRRQSFPLRAACAGHRVGEALADRCLAERR